MSSGKENKKALLKNLSKAFAKVKRFNFILRRVRVRARAAK
jgi:hypothetical protein